jgi:hypothetical protein
MPGFSRELVEHRLLIKSSFRPYKQPAQRFNLIIHDRIKEEVERLLDVGFIQPCQYTEWVSNIYNTLCYNSPNLSLIIIISGLVMHDVTGLISSESSQGHFLFNLNLNHRIQTNRF